MIPILLAMFTNSFGRECFQLAHPNICCLYLGGFSFCLKKDKGSLLNYQSQNPAKDLGDIL